MKISINFLPVLFVLILTSIEGQAQTTNTPNLDSIKVITYKVKGITCASDVKTIAGNIEKLSGIINCKADKPGATTNFELKFNPARVTEKEIVAAIENTGGCQNPNDRPYKVKQ